MATRFSASFKHHNLVRSFSSAPSPCSTSATPSRSVATATAAAASLTPPTYVEAPTPTPPTPAGVLELDDPERLFASVPTRTLVSTLANLYLMAMGPAVDVGMAVARATLEGPKDGANGVARRVILEAMRRTVYGHFCAGEDLESASRTLRGMWDMGLRGILDYGLEDADDNEACDRNLREFLNTVETTAKLPASSVSFACVKVTAICPIRLLEKASHHFRWRQRDATHPLPWATPGESFPVLAGDGISPLHHTPERPESLTTEEERDLELARGRLSTLCGRCSELGLPLLVDAEYSAVQPAIDHLTYAAMLGFNRPGYAPIVYGTVQAYLKDSMTRLALAVEAAGRHGVPVGFKLVRGAYLSREAREATAMGPGTQSPVHDSIGETHACYDRCASYMLDRIAAARSASPAAATAVVLATHNVQSGKAAAARAEELGLHKGDWRLQFAQLKGMAEGLSMGLRNAGFNVSKYLAFGPVEKVVPYLIRRAEENRGLLSASSVDRQLMRKEVMRRAKVAALNS